MIEAIDNLGIEYLFGSSSLFLDHLALGITNALIWIPMYIALLLLIVKNNDNMPLIMLCFACSVLAVLLATSLTTMVTKPLVERLRPCNEPTVKYLAQIAGNLHNKDYSFFSSHAATSISVVVFFTLLVRSALLSSVLFIWSMMTCWTRLYLGQHYLTDVLVGLAWGTCSAFIAYYIFCKFSRRLGIKSNFISSQYTATGYSILDIDVVVSVVICTVIADLLFIAI